MENIQFLDQTVGQYTLLQIENSLSRVLQLCVNLSPDFCKTLFALLSQPGATVFATSEMFNLCAFCILKSEDDFLQFASVIL